MLEVFSKSLQEMTTDEIRALIKLEIPEAWFSRNEGACQVQRDPGFLGGQLDAGGTQELADRMRAVGLGLWCVVVGSRDLSFDLS